MFAVLFICNNHLRKAGGIYMEKLYTIIFVFEKTKQDRKPAVQSKVCYAWVQFYLQWNNASM
jgi:hypothetical protein